MWCLARVLPFLIGDKVHQEDEYWDHYLQLLSIVEYIFAPVVTKRMSAYLAMMIEDFLAEFNDLYQRRLHYLVHIPSWMNKYVAITPSLLNIGTH